VDLRAPDATALGKVGNRCAGSAFRAPFDSLVRLGAGNGDIHLDEALRLQACVREGVRLGLLHSTLPVGGDGLLAAAARGAMGGGLGCHLFVPTPEDLGGGDGGVLATLGAEGEDALVALAATHGVPWAKVGVTGGAHVTATLSGRTEMAIELNDLAALAGSHQPGR
jgi:hypothetical protein